MDAKHFMRTTIALWQATKHVRFSDPSMDHKFERSRFGSDRIGLWITIHVDVGEKGKQGTSCIDARQAHTKPDWGLV